VLWAQHLLRLERKADNCFAASLRMARPIITLTTDFGVADSYVAQMKGVILSINSDVQLIDVTHAIPPQNVVHAAFVVADTYQRFPRGTIHVVVVDPGVGSTRTPVAVEAAGHCFVAPDNGVLSQVLRNSAATRIVELTERRFWLQPLSNTFHGRDLFAPVAAHLSLGVDLGELGSAYSRPLHLLDVPAPRKTPDGWIGEVLWVDSFGNLVTNIHERDLPPADRQRVVVQIGDHEIAGIQRYYAEARAGEFVALIGSSGRLEIAVRDGNAARMLQSAAGERIRIMFPPAQPVGVERP
jgi:S-adenosylmethionine hydrolase